MRISSLESDRGYHVHFSACRFYLDGHERNNVITIDEEKRWALTEIRDEFGNPVFDKAGNRRTAEDRGAWRIDCDPWLREAMEAPQEEGDTLSAVIYGMIATP